jgi:hypothetical protein
MKPLVLLLLLTVPIQAQTLADVARRERARQARLHGGQVYSGKGTKIESVPPGTVPEIPAATTPAAPGAAAPAPAAPKPPAPPAAAPAVPRPADPAVQWNADVAKLRARIPELEEQERALQLQVNQITNQLFAPVSDQVTKDQAQARLGETQNKLTAVRTELEETKKTLDQMQVQGPPK